MGCLCSKDTKQKGHSGINVSSSASDDKIDRTQNISDSVKDVAPAFEMRQSSIRSLSTAYTTHWTATRTNSVNDTITTLVDTRNLNASWKKNGQSIIMIPQSEHLLKRIWINKRGHMLRTWKKRYCVLEKNELKYYQAADSNPPYGQGLKGQIALLGAVCSVSLNGTSLCVEIFGNLGEKDLFFELEFTEEGQEWVRTLQWAIRKATMTSMVHSMRAKVASTADVDLKDKGAKYTSCTDWLAHQKTQFSAAVAKLLSSTRTVRILQYTGQGRVAVVPGFLRLWTAFQDPDYIPDEFTPNSCIGVAYRECYGGEGVEEQEERIFSLADLQDIQLYEHPQLVNTPDNMSCFTPADEQRSNQHSDGAIVDVTAHRHCEGRRSKIVSLQTRHGHSVDIVACCLRDYDEFCLSLRDVVLHQTLLRKLESAVDGKAATAASHTLSAGAATGASVCLACVSILHNPLHC